MKAIQLMLAVVSLVVGVSANAGEYQVCPDSGFAWGDSMRSKLQYDEGDDLKKLSRGDRARVFAHYLVDQWSSRIDMSGVVGSEPVLIKQSEDVYEFRAFNYSGVIVFDEAPSQSSFTWARAIGWKDYTERCLNLLTFDQERHIRLKYGESNLD